jgi:hypothetical protein
MSSVIASDGEAIQGQEGNLNGFVAPRLAMASRSPRSTLGAAKGYTTMLSRFAARVMPV